MKINKISITSSKNDYGFILKQPSFKNLWSEHKSWGAVVNPRSKDVSFKVFTYPDTKRAVLSIFNKENGLISEHELENKGGGIFETKNPINSACAPVGASYYYTLYKGNGDIDTVKDPYSYKQDKLMGESVIYDHSDYVWHDDKWYKNSKNRVSRLANKKNKLTPVRALKILEVNIATISKSGTFEDAKEYFKKIKDMGFNAIEIMPVENTYSFNWGYDGVDKLAPSGYLGGPDKLKELIDYAHSVDLNVIMDMVPNHVGPDGASLLRTGPYIKSGNCFGEAFNYEGDNSRYVRDFIVNSALNWIDNYHCDGLRLDMTKLMNSDYTLQQIAADVNYHKPDAFLIAEDSRENISIDGDSYWYNPDELHDKRIINPLYDTEYAKDRDEYTHAQAIESIRQGNIPLSRLGFDSEWDFIYYHSLNSALYGLADLDTIEKACYCSQDKVKYIASHDEIGNFDGTRFLSKFIVSELNLNNNIILENKDILRANLRAKLKNTSQEESLNIIKCQKAQFIAQNLIKMFQEGKLDCYYPQTDESNWYFAENILNSLNIVSNGSITPNRVKEAFEKGMSKCKLAQAFTFSIPGPKMVFQGDESMDITPFKFFREFESIKDEENLEIEKGYNTGLDALMDSKLGNIEYSEKARNMMDGFRNLMFDLNELNNENSCLKKGYLQKNSTIKHPVSNVIAFHSFDSESNNELFSITNFNNNSYSDKSGKYSIRFPKGVWIEKINTDDKKYCGNGLINNIIESDGCNNSDINLAGLSCAIFKKIA